MKSNQESCICCHKTTFDDTEKVFEFNDSIICATCVILINQYLTSVSQVNQSSTPQLERPNNSLSILTPSEIVNFLNEDVIKQEKAKTKFAIALYQHIQRINNPNIEYKSNVLCFGPTGSGKTELARAISKILQVPMVVVDCSRYSPTGYIGDSPQSMIEHLLVESNYNIGVAEKGIIVLDEVDKLSTRNHAEHKSLKEGVQQEILKIAEGTKILIRQQQREFLINTSKILFIASGAFVDLPSVMGLKKEKEISLFDQAASKEAKVESGWQEKVTSKDIEKFGFIPEFLGRFPIVTYTEELSIDDFIHILLKTKKSAINQLASILLLDGITFEIERELLVSIATEAKKSDLGARALSGVIERHLESIFMNIDKYRNRHLLISPKGIQFLDPALSQGFVHTVV